MIYVNSDMTDVVQNSTDTSHAANNNHEQPKHEESVAYTDEDGTATAAVTEGQVKLQAFWPSTTDEIKRIKSVDAKNQALPLARIKKIMKLDEDVRMISAEAPLLFAKAAEIFIHELTLRAWVHTEENKRRTLQRNDIAVAIMKYDQFDFLIDIVPRDELRQPKKETVAETKPSNPGDQVQYYLQLAQQAQNALQQTSSVGPLQTAAGQLQQPHQQTMNVNPIQLLQGASMLQAPNMAGQITIGSPQNILLNMQAQPHQQPHQQHHQQIQLVQQIITPNGEYQHVPIQIPQNQMNVIRMQVQNQHMQQQQPIIITSPLQGQQILQMNTTQSPQQQQQQHQQHQQSAVQQQQQTTSMYISAPDDQ